MVGCSQKEHTLAGLLPPPPEKTVHPMLNLIRKTLRQNPGYATNHLFLNIDIVWIHMNPPLFATNPPAPPPPPALFFFTFLLYSTLPQLYNYKKCHFLFKRFLILYSTITIRAQDFYVVIVDEGENMPRKFFVCYSQSIEE